MTSIAFIAGVFPLVIARGDGSEMRQAMGVAVFAGMIGVTLFGLFLTPVFYTVIMKLGRRMATVPATSSDSSAFCGAARGDARPTAGVAAITTVVLILTPGSL